MLRGAVQMIIVVMVICLRIHMNVECVMCLFCWEMVRWVTLCVLFPVITLGCIWLALSMHFWRGICILFWCDYLGLYMVGTLNEYSARYLYTFLV